MKDYPPNNNAFINELKSKLKSEPSDNLNSEPSNNLNSEPSNKLNGEPNKKLNKRHARIMEPMSPINKMEDYIKKDTKTGGVTGSYQAEKGGKLYQIKPPIYDNAYDRRLKVGDLDIENFGEVIASYIAQNLVGNYRAPSVTPIIDFVNMKVYVGSQYMIGEHVQTLDKFAKEGEGVKISGKHVRIVQSNNPNPGEMSIDGDLKNELCTAIALSAVLGDHDVNPGNMIIYEKDGEQIIARIDFGHAFNDLLKYSKINGGQVRDTQYPLLDFFNREQVGGVLGAPSKLWRDYPDLIPSKEMVDALRLMSEDFQSKVNKGINEAKDEFTKIITEMDEKGSPHIVKSLDAIVPEAIGGPGGCVDHQRSLSESHLTLDKKDNQDPNDLSKSADAAIPTANSIAKLGPIFDRMNNFVQKQGVDLKKVANVMELQLAIDATLKNPNEFQFQKLSNLYAKVKGELPQSDNTIHWIKSGNNDEAKLCTLDEFISQRASYLDQKDTKVIDRIKGIANGNKRANFQSFKDIFLAATRETPEVPENSLTP